MIKINKFTTINILNSLILFSINCKHHDLVDIKKLNHDVITDIKYATKNNFTKKAVYPKKAKCYLLKHVAKDFNAAIKEFKKLGYKVKIWDCYRPQHIQCKFWKICPDENYVQKPKKGSRHSRGCAIDLTLVDKNGNELDMGTEFDDFSKKAHINCKDISQKAIKNRKLLSDIMSKHNFKVLKTEWWHYDYIDWQNHPILDISFDELELNYISL